MPNNKTDLQVNHHRHIRPIGIVGPSLFEEIGYSLSRVQNDHDIAEDI